MSFESDLIQTDSSSDQCIISRIKLDDESNFSNIKLACVANLGG